MKWYIVLAVFYSLIISCQSGFMENKESPSTDTTGVENIIQVPSTKCYETIEKGDTFKLTIEVYSDVVAGILEYHYQHHADVIGHLQGLRSGDTLIADYVYTVNGQENAKQVAFLLEDVFATEGTGPMEEHNGQKYFPDRTNITFDKGIKFLRQDCDNPESTIFSGLAGIWELIFIDDMRISFDSLYPDKKPHLLFTNGVRDQFSGHTSCNNLRGMFEERGNSFRFKKPMAMTKMYCEGEGEKIFLNKLDKVDSYTIQDDELIFYQNGQAILRFSNK